MAFRLNKQQRIAAIKFYYQAGSNATEASRLLSAEYHIPQVQGRNIKVLVDKFENTGSVNDAPRSGRPNTATCDEKGDALLASITRSPQKSVRRLSLELEISRQSVHNLLKKKKLFPYVPRLFHALHDGDADRRLQFAELFLEMLRNDRTVQDKVWWSDEACFKLNGHINRHNCVYWAAENPHIIIDKEVNLPGITVWAAISSEGLIGPFFLDGRVNGERYLNMLQTQFYPLVQHHEDFFFQQDGAPPHYATAVREWLNETFTDRWIGRRGPMEWPARSPDLTPPDFFLWGVLKDLVYKQNPTSIQQLRHVIEEQMQTIDIDMCQKVCRSVAGRLQQCIDHNGERFEQYK